MHKTQNTMSLIFALLCGLAACAPVTEIGFRNPDEALFDRGMDAVRQNRCSVARLTLETLLNTYPDSSYADRAKLAFRDPTFATCPDVTSR